MNIRAYCGVKMIYHCACWVLYIYQRNHIHMYKGLILSILRFNIKVDLEMIWVSPEASPVTLLEP